MKFIKISALVMVVSCIGFITLKGIFEKIHADAMGIFSTSKFSIIPLKEYQRQVYRMSRRDEKSLTFEQFKHDEQWKLQQEAQLLKRAIEMIEALKENGQIQKG